jgi:hypothetical protein
MSEFTCEKCGETYKKTRSDEDCWKEFHDLMPECAHDEISILCDDCWLQFMDWFKTLSSAQKKKMREDALTEKK